MVMHLLSPLHGNQGVIDAVKGNVDGVPVAYHSAFYVNGTECDLTGKPRVGVARVSAGLSRRQKNDQSHAVSCAEEIRCLLTFNSKPNFSGSFATAEVSTTVL